MTELELQHLRREKWRLDGEPIRTLEEGREFVDSAGMCLVYPVRPIPLLPTFVGAVIGGDQKLPSRRNGFADPRTRAAEELLVRLARSKFAFEGRLYGETLLLSPSVFPYYYALVGDRKPRQPIHSRASGKGSPLTEHLFHKLEEKGPLTRGQLQEQLGGALSEPALDRALDELCSALKITAVDHNPKTGDTWDVYYRWTPELVNEGVRTSDAEALSALISKYLDCVVAATQEEVETFFSAMASRTRVAEVVKALLAAREFIYTPSETRTLITVAHSNVRSGAPSRGADTGTLGPRRRNG